jgi:hypothetical protein
LSREPDGSTSLELIGTDFKSGAEVTSNNTLMKKPKFKDLAVGSSNSFTRIVLKKKVCKNTPGSFVVTNPGVAGSTPFSCGERCN